MQLNRKKEKYADLHSKNNNNNNHTKVRERAKRRKGKNTKNWEKE